VARVVAVVVAVVVVVVLGLAVAAPAPVSASRVAGPEQPDRCGDPSGARPQRCVGPVVDESGGGGDTVTIVLSVVVGLGVAGTAFVLLRRQLSRSAQP